jgi:protoporphyrinogen IX oxidase
MTTFLKFIHLATIAVWSGGLIILPFLFWQRRGIETGPGLERLHRLTRFVYVSDIGRCSDCLSRVRVGNFR